MNDKCETKRNITTFQLIFVWGLSLVLSCSAVGMAGYTLTKERINYSCERNGHGFAPRFNTQPPDAAVIQGLGLSQDSDKLRAASSMAKKVYICDVCTYCGKTATKE